MAVAATRPTTPQQARDWLWADWHVPGTAPVGPGGNLLGRIHEMIRDIRREDPAFGDFVANPHLAREKISSYYCRLDGIVSEVERKVAALRRGTVV